ncbi:MAG: M23 family metallopeptidase [Bacteroidetes bacterium]|nr:M23 family metallopeptidase [Bacteroidota bacterium]
MKIFYLSCVFFVVFYKITLHVSAQEEYEESGFRSPVDIPILPAATFGELRADHFHAGIDIKTEGVEGKKLYAVSDGYVSRIKISSKGYGKTVYITHQNGLVSVYAHLRNFSPAIGQFVKKVQYRKRMYEVDVFPSRRQIPVRKGEVIGFSGNSGGSGGPHLHFEIRDAITENAINPLEFGFKITDNIKPKINRLFIYPIDDNSFICGKNEKQIFPATGNNGIYSISQQTVEVCGNIGFGIHTDDYLNGTGNICGIYSIDMYVDSLHVYGVEFNEISFAETRYINSHTDFEEAEVNRKWIHKAFLEPNNRLSNYNNLINRGIYSFSDDTVHTVCFIVRDSYKNTSILNFNVKAVEKVTSVQRAECMHVMPFQQANFFENEDIRVSIPAYALYDTICFSCRISPGISGAVSKLFHIHSTSVPLHYPMTVEIRPDPVKEELKRKLVVAKVREGRLYPFGGDYSDGFVSVKTDEFGGYAVFIDTVCPEIQQVNLPDSADMRKADRIKLKISDNLSGIAKYNGFIDKKWVLFEYDPKNKLITHYFEEKMLRKNVLHNFRLEVEDAVHNVAVYEVVFFY